MPKRKAKPVDLVEDDYPVPTRTPYVVDNPFSHYTKEEARARLAILYPQWRQMDYEIQQLERIVRSFNVVYYDKDGKVCHAV